MRTLLILTGHSKGLGKAIFDRFLMEDSTQIVAVSRTSLELENSRVHELALDLSDLAALESSLPKIFSDGEFDRYILINNAGWIGDVKPIGKLNPKGIKEVMNLNLLAPITLCNAFVKNYQENKGQKIIINISSGAAKKPLAGWGEYCSSKAGLEMFSKVAGQELRNKGFSVFSLAPGIVDTAMQGEIRNAEPEDFPALDRFVQYKTEGLLSTAEEVSEKILHLINHPEKFVDVVQDVRQFEVD
ncbi:SDR family NAD(P)-dependent oxidoreductase [Algoriphagus sanaruensis]|uniref:Short-chain dehydrogenase n=1 Tax=Algoriphagus sanaruensis TaxID=1727163 RepID=A0A142EM36_9BACT|nr:SDR family NAD(P)-dependent oxidoreductase [Algoriphagus sanaruensis]AMQ56191.1 hypothetical protein AO498_07175 [Algoriphagus sanaruensis]